MKGISLMLACLMVFSVGLYGQEALTIDDIISMVKAKLRSRTIVQKVNLSSMQYAPSVKDIVRLKKAGASRRVVDAVLAAPVTGPSEVPATSSPAPSPQPSWTSSSTMASSEPQATSPKPRSGGLEEGAYPKIELFGGYSRFGTEGGVGLNGLNIAFSYNLIDWLGLVVDSSSHYANIGTDASIHSLHFGPQFAFRFNKVTPFVRPLVGFSHIREDLFGIPVVRETGFSFGFGGGLDVKVANHVAIRAVQFDYVNIRIGGFGSDNARLSLGVVGRW